jgi:pimeloyl-ACP methyl ester carboxylesterase
MVRLRFAEALALAGLVCVAACSSGDDHPSPYVYESTGPGLPGRQGKLPTSASGRLTGSACPFTVPTGWLANCGRLTVPADRTGADTSRSLWLPVAVFKSTSMSPATDPVVYLAGGPGSPALDEVTGQPSAFEPLLADRDLVVFDQRGTGFALPALLCPELDSASSSADGGVTAPTQACRDRLVASSVVPSDYTTAANAADVADLRHELGYDAWNLFGVSYGTRLALTVMRDHPEGLRSVVIDSVLPLDVDFLADGLPNAQAAFDALFTSCVLQAKCRSTYPDLENVFYGLADQLDSAPETIVLSDGRYAKVDGSTLVHVVHQLLYSGEWLTVLPEVIFQIREKNYSVLSKLLPLIAGSDAAMGAGMYFSVVCADMVPFTSMVPGQPPPSTVRRQIANAIGGTQILDVCSVWNVPASGAIEHQPVQSAIPALVLSGGHDPVTPPRWGQAASQTLSSSFWVTFLGQAHGVFLDTCGAAMVNQFMRDPATNPAPLCPHLDDDIAFVVPATRVASSASLSPVNLGALLRRLNHPIR